MATAKQKITRKAKTANINPATGLTPMQEEFCREYLADFNGTRAAKQAGYSAKTAYSQANRLLKKAEVQAFLATLQKPRLEKFEVTQDRIMQEVAALAFSNIMDFVTVENGQAWVDLAKCTREQAAALAAFEVIEMPPAMRMVDGEMEAREVLKVKIKLWDKMAALEALMRRHNLVKPIEVMHNHKGTVKLESADLARRVAFMLRKQIESQKKKPADPASDSPE